MRDFLYIVRHLGLLGTIGYCFGMILDWVFEILFFRLLPAAVVLQVLYQCIRWGLRHGTE